MKDPFNRACMVWDHQNTQLLKWYKRLGEIRKGCSAFRSGEFIPVYSAHKTIAYKRVDDSSEVLVAVNLDEEKVEINIGEEWNHSYTLLGISPENGTLSLDTHSYAMLTRMI